MEKRNVALHQIDWRFCVFAVGLMLSAAILASAQNAQPPREPQTIVIEPIDGTQVRLRLEGRENWTVESASFTIQTDSDSVNLVAQRGNNRINTRSIAETFELQIAPAGNLGFALTNSKIER